VVKDSFFSLNFSTALPGDSPGERKPMSIFQSDEPKQGELLPGLAGKTARPFAGFLPRLLALLIDGVALYAAAGMALRSAREPLLELNPWLPYLGLVVGFLYFMLAAGPVGRGRTLGKAVLGLHVVGRDGEPVGWGPALRRTLLQYAGVYGVMNLGLLDSRYYLLAWPPDARYAGLLTFMFLGLGSLTLAIALALSMAMHPFKRSWHDQLAGTFVTREPTPTLFLETLATPPDVLTERKLANHLKMTLSFWFVSLVVLAFGPLQQLGRGDVRAQMADAAALNKGSLAGGNLTVLYLSYPSTEAKLMFENAVRHERAARIARNEAAPTTETLRTQWVDGQALYLMTYQRRGAFRVADVASPAFRRRMEVLRQQIWPLWLAYRARWEKATHTPAPPARQFVVMVYEQAQILFYGETRVVVKAQGPADPSAGPLTFMANPSATATASGERPTTGTTASGP
jgi:uncharacterized RDD family membrane protein YckC